jgi:phage tail-like protein
MRGDVVGLAHPAGALPSAHPLGALLPACLQEDEFAMRWTSGFDAVLAPVVSVLDCLDAYVDPSTAPPDFLEWMAGWVGIDLDEHWAGGRARQAVAAAIGLHRQRGTLAGLHAQLEVASGGRVEIDEPGGVTWSAVPTGAVASGGGTALLIRVYVRDPDDVRPTALDALVEAAKPAHLPHMIEVVRDDRLS